MSREISVGLALVQAVLSRPSTADVANEGVLELYPVPHGSTGMDRREYPHDGEDALYFISLTITRDKRRPRERIDEIIKPVISSARMSLKMHSCNPSFHVTAVNPQSTLVLRLNRLDQAPIWNHVRRRQEEKFNLWCTSAVIYVCQTTKLNRSPGMIRGCP